VLFRDSIADAAHVAGVSRQMRRRARGDGEGIYDTALSRGREVIELPGTHPVSRASTKSNHQLGTISLTDVVPLANLVVPVLTTPLLRPVWIGRIRAPW